MSCNFELSDSDIKNIKKKLCSKIKIENINVAELESIQEYDSFVRQIDNSKICVQERFPIKIELDRAYCFDENKFQERMSKLIEFCSEFIAEDINNFIVKHNCRKIYLRNFSLSIYGDFSSANYHVDMATRIMFVVDKQ